MVKDYAVTAGSALNAVAFASIIGVTGLASDNQKLWPVYQPEITAQHPVAQAPAMRARAAVSTEIAVDHGAAQLANMAKLATEIAGKSRGVDAEIGAAVEENFFDWL